MNITIKLKDDKFQRYLTQLHKKHKDLRPFFKIAKTVLDRSIMKTFRAQGRPNKWIGHSSLTSASRSMEGTGTSLLMRYGTLRQSIGTDILNITKTKMEYGTKQLKGAMLHYGGTIKPKHSTYLAIPYPGVKGKPRDYENTFFAKKTLFQNLGGGEIKPLFMLKKKVKIPARPYMMYQEEDVDVLGELLFNFVLNIKNYKNLI